MPVRGAGALAWALMLTSCAATDKYDDAVADRCTDIDSSEPSKSALTDASGGENWFVKEVLEKATDRDDIPTKLEEYLQSNASDAVGMKLIGVLLFVLVLITFWCCCYTCWPCCKCCRVCRATNEKKTTGFACKLVGTVVVLGIGAGLVVCWIFSAAAYEDVDNGIGRFGCASAELAKAIAVGQDDTYFIGLAPLITRFTDMSSVFDDDSTFVTAFNALVDDTEEIDQAFAFATETLTLLEEMMDVSSNANPTGHTCAMCGPLKTMLAEVKTTMADSLASALKTARADAKDALDSDTRAELRELFTDSTEPLDKVDDLLGDALDELVDGDTWDQIVDANKQGKMSMFVLPGLGIVAVLFGCLGYLAFMLRENSNGRATALPHRCSCCSWCCGFLVALLCFLIGGILQIVGVPLGVACLALDEISGSVIENVQPALELDVVDEDTLTVVKDIVDFCLNPPDFTVSANLADILQIENASGGMQTMRQMVENDLKDQINEGFDELAEKSTGVTEDLADDDRVVALRQFVYQHGGNISSLIVIDKDSMETEMTSAGIAIPADTAWGTDYPSLVNTTLSCDDYTFEGATLTGNAEYWADFVQADYQATGLCNWPSGLDACSNETNCEAASFIVETKATLMDSSTSSFRCDVFDCSTDVWAAGADGVATDWSTCMDSTYAYTRKTTNCTLAEFEEYLKEFDTRIDVAFKTLDSFAASMKTTINEDLRDLLDDTIIDEVTDILDGLECNFLGEYYRDIVYGLCYEVVGGVAYIGFLWVIIGALMCALIIATYALWRRSVDNYNWDSEHPGEGGSMPSGVAGDDDDTN